MALALLIAVASIDNQVARTPPMGYRSWEQWGINISAELHATIDSVLLKMTPADARAA